MFVLVREERVVKKIEIVLSDEEYGVLLSKVEKICLKDEDVIMLDGWEEEVLKVIGEDVKSLVFDGDMLFDEWNGDMFDGRICDSNR